MKSILVTKDVNLRMKARSIGLLCEDYINDKVINVDIFENRMKCSRGRPYFDRPYLFIQRGAGYQ